MKKNKKIVLTYGTFDMFHIGHLNLIKRLKKGDTYLIVGLSTDEFNSKKGKKTLIPYKHRKEILESTIYVDKVIPENNWEQKVDDIIKYKVDVFAMGDDWKGKFDFLKKHCKVEYLERTKNVSTTQLKQAILNFDTISKEELIKAFTIIEQLKKILL